MSTDNKLKNTTLLYFFVHQATTPSQRHPKTRHPDPLQQHPQTILTQPHALYPRQLSIFVALRRHTFNFYPLWYARSVGLYETPLLAAKHPRELAPACTQMYKSLSPMSSISARRIMSHATSGRKCICVRICAGAGRVSNRYVDVT